MSATDAFIIPVAPAHEGSHEEGVAESLQHWSPVMLGRDSGTIAQV